MADKSQLNPYRPRLIRGNRQRDKTLAELAVGYFLETKCGLPIVGWAPLGAGNKEGDFLAQLPEADQMFIEVKSPGWEAEVVRGEGRESPRLCQPKYIHGETRSIAPWQAVREAVKKAYPKMPGLMPTILVIHDDLFVSPDYCSADIALYCPRSSGHTAGYLSENGCFVDSTYERLGAVGILGVDYKPSSGRYRFSLFDNPHCLRRAAIPRAVVQVFSVYGSQHRSPRGERNHG